MTRVAGAAQYVPHHRRDAGEAMVRVRVRLGLGLGLGLGTIEGMPGSGLGLGTIEGMPEKRWCQPCSTKSREAIRSYLHAHRGKGGGGRWREVEGDGGRWREMVSTCWSFSSVAAASAL